MLTMAAPVGKVQQQQQQDDQLLQLDHAVRAIQTKQSTPLTFEALYRVVENVCGSGQSATLYLRLQQRCAEHLQTVRGELLR
jgi:hypothetical protein